MALLPVWAISASDHHAHRPSSVCCVPQCIVAYCSESQCVAVCCGVHCSAFCSVLQRAGVSARLQRAITKQLHLSPVNCPHATTPPTLHQGHLGV